MLLKKSLIATAGLLASFACSASDVSLAFNNDNVVLGYDFEMQETLKLKGEYLQTVDNGYMVDTGVYAFQEVGAIYSELGAKAIMMDTDNGDGYAAAFGGILGLYLTEELTVEGNIHHSPTILSAGDTDNLLQFGGRVTYSALPNADLFIEYRYTDIDYDSKPSESVNRDLLFGMTWVF